MLSEPEFQKLCEKIASQLRESRDEYLSRCVDSWLSDNLNYDYIVSQVHERIDVLRMAGRMQSSITDQILDTPRFTTLVTRAINNATVGVIDEAVERVTAIIQNQSGSLGDL